MGQSSPLIFPEASWDGSHPQGQEEQQGSEGRPLQSLNKGELTPDAHFNWVTLGTILRTTSRRTGQKPGEQMGDYFNNPGER